MTKNHTSIDHLVQGSTVTPVSLPQKEMEPVANAKQEQVGLQEVSEHKMSEEVKEYIQHRDEVINVPPDISQIGVRSVANPIFPTFNPKKLPLSDDSILKGLHKSVKSSIRWLAEYCMFILRQTHVTLKRVHGKIVRVAT